MSLQLAQLEESTIINSLKDYLNTNIVVPYNAEVVGTNFPAPLGIELSGPSDPDIIPTVPLITIDKPIDSRPFEIGGIGDGDGYVWNQIRLHFFPALDSSQQSSNQAESKLKKYARYVLGSKVGAYIPLYDYSASPPTKLDVAEVTDSRLVQIQGRVTSVLNIERNRFDWIITLKYMIQGID